MQLIAFSCNNIGPFFDRTVTTYFHDGKFLIKAPIGSGKSFLFFDGPLFGLYKTSSRPMLSMKAEQGRIKVLFKHEGKVLLVKRDIGRTKSGNDTVKSSLFVLTDETTNIQSLFLKDEVLSWEFDGIGELEKRVGLEQIVSKNETDVQTTLESFLPPKEVFLSTTMLLQDSDNVFELPPADRIALLKEVFGLISIDSATDRINEERKFVSAALKTKGDTSQVDRKLQDYLGSLARGAELLQEEGFQPLISEIGLIQDKITIQDFQLDQEWETLCEKLAGDASEKLQSLQKLLGAEEAQQKSLQEAKREKQNIQEELEEARKTLLTVGKNLESIPDERLKKHNEKKQQLQEQIDTFREKLPTEWFMGNENLQGNIHALRTKVQEQIQKGVSLHEQKEFLNKNIQQLKERTQEEKENLLVHKKTLEELQNTYESKKVYYCEEIKANCPFIEEINKSFFTTLQKNIAHAEDTLNTYQEKITKTNTTEQILQKEEELKTIEATIVSLKESAPLCFRKQIDAAKEQFDDLIEQQQLSQREDIHLAKHAQERENNLVKKAQYEEKVVTLEKSGKQIDEKIQKLSETVDEKSITQTKSQIDNLQNRLSTIAKILQTVDRIKDLTNSHKDTQWEIKNLQEREKILTDLYRIFSKEIMIKVLEDSLPYFAEYINNLLAKMVPFIVKFQPKKTSSDKLELEISIHDQHGERTAKSLSGGQKAILRLAWILAVAQMTGAKQLFLDETINNIDQETISQVTEMLEDYVKSTNISLYLVTHSTQLQTMSLWDNTISIEHTHET